MFLKRLSLHNFRQFKEADICFERGLTAIVGPNGSGKTTILEAIAWVLYGEQRGTKDSIRHKWAEDGSGPAVELEFDIGNRSYRVERDLKKANAIHFASEGEVTHASSLSGVNEWSEKTLGLNYERFKNSFCTEQKQLDFLKFRDQEKKQEEVAKMLGYDALRAAGKLAEQRATAAKNELKGYTDFLSSGADKEAELKAAKETLALLEKELALLVRKGEEVLAKKNELDEKRKAADEALDIIRQMEERREVGRQLKKNLDDLIAQAALLQSQLAERKRLEPNAKRWEDLTSSIRLRQSQLQSASERNAKEQLLKHNEEQIAECEKKIVELGPCDVDAVAKAVSEAEASMAEARDMHGKALTAWQVAKTEVAARLNALQSSSNELLAELEFVRASEAAGKCSTCGQPLPDGHAPRSGELVARIEEIALQLSVDKKEEETLANQPDSVTQAAMGESKAAQDLSAAQSRRESVMGIGKTRYELQGRIDSLQEKNRVLVKEMANLPIPPDPKQLGADEKEAALLLVERDRYVALSDIPTRADENKKATDNAQAAFVEEKARQDKQAGRLKELDHDAATAQAVIDAHKLLATEAAELDTQIKIRKADVDRQRQVVAKAEKDAAEFLEVKKKVSELDQTVSMNSHLDKGMSELRQQLNKELPNRLCAHASEALSALTGGRYTQVKLDAKLCAQLIDDEEVTKEVISGGEEDIVHLALRMGLTSMMQDSGGQPMSLLILDEVFGSLDDERRVHVMEMLTNLRETYEQILFISHIDDVRNAADRWLEVVYDRAAKTSRIVKRGDDLPKLGY